MCHGLRVGLIGLVVVLCALTAGAATSDSKPSLNLAVRSYQYGETAALVLDVSFDAGALLATGLQFDIESTVGSSVKVAAGPAAESVNKTVAVADIGANHKRVVVFGLTPEVIWSGTLATITVAAGEPGDRDELSIRLNSAVAVDRSVAASTLASAEFNAHVVTPGSRLFPGHESLALTLPPAPVYATMPCTADVNADGIIDVADLQLQAAMASSGMYGRCDLNGDGRATGNDFETVLKAILGRGVGQQSSQRSRREQ